MYVNEKMKLNKFQQVNIPTNKDYFARAGKRMPDEAMFTGDEPVDFMPQGDKLQQIADMDAYDQAMQAEEDAKKKTK